MDDFGIEKSKQVIQTKHWKDLTREEINMIDDIEKRKVYREKWDFCIRRVINTLYAGIKNKSKFKFSNPDNKLTCANMLADLANYYKVKGFNREEIINIITEGDIKKRY